MYSYSVAGIARLKTSHEDLQLVFNTAIKYVNGSIFCGYRNEADQTKAFNENKSKVKYPNSFHNKLPSMAIDAGPYFIEITNTDWNDRLAFALYAGEILHIGKRLLIEKQITHEIVWGGDWNRNGRTTDHSFLDLPHFQAIKKDSPTTIEV